MNAKSTLAALALMGAGSVSAAGFTWSYNGKEPYQSAVIVWTDEDLNNDMAKEDIDYKRLQVLEKLTNTTDAVTFDWIDERCARSGTIDGIKVDVVKSANTSYRVNHSFLYTTERKGWAFTLLVNLDKDGHISEFAASDVMETRILSLNHGETFLTVTEANLTSGVSTYALSRLRNAGAPVITHHAPDAPLIDDTPQSATRDRTATPGGMFVFDITNAVNGFTYHVIATDDLSKPFERCGVDNFAMTDGRLAFEIPIIPDAKIMFYRVEVAGTMP